MHVNERAAAEYGHLMYYAQVHLKGRATFFVCRQQFAKIILMDIVLRLPHTNVPVKYC